MTVDFPSQMLSFTLEAWNWQSKCSIDFSLTTLFIPSNVQSLILITLSPPPITSLLLREWNEPETNECFFPVSYQNSAIDEDRRLNYSDILRFLKFFFLIYDEWNDWMSNVPQSTLPLSKKKKKKKKKFQTVDGNFFKKMEVFWRNTFLFSSRWTFNIVKRQRVCLKLNNCIFFFFFVWKQPGLLMPVAHKDIGLFWDLGTLESGIFVQFILFQYSNGIILRKWFLYIFFFHYYF